jgi:pyruvate dehydrogenase E1 component alpha subunit/2-oxoisovalerate dehydrogenase E1 component alpha subunit
MAQSMLGPNPAEQINFAKETLVSAYRHMLVARVLDDKLASLYRAGKIHGGVFLGRGQEALSAAVGVSLKRGDIFAPLIRDAAGRLAFGEALLDSVRTYLGSRLGPMRGRDGNIHRGRPRDGLLPMISHLGAMISVVNGVLMAHRFKGVQGRVGAACMGDGASSTGSFHEALNQAAVERLPLVLVVANNQYAYSTPNSRQFACDTLAEKAAGYGVQGHSVDGTDLIACLNVVGRAVRLAREGNGPQFVVASLLRLCGHGEHDDASYVDAGLKAAEAGRDCLRVAEAQLTSNGMASSSQLDQWRAAAIDSVEQAVARVQREPAPDAREEDWRAISASHLCEGQLP